MEVNFYNTNYAPNFGAHKIAKAKNTINGVTTHIDIYKLKPSDKPFLKKLLEKISIKEMYPHLEDGQVKIWQDMVRYSIFNAISPMHSSYLAMCNNAPCGVATCTEGKVLNVLDISSIPVDKNKKANLSGLTMLYHLFLNAKKNNTEKIALEALKSSPGNPVQKYSQLGLKKVEEGTRYIQMECDSANIDKQINTLKTKIQYRECKPVNVNLEEIAIY